MASSTLSASLQAAFLPSSNNSSPRLVSLVTLHTSSAIRRMVAPAAWKKSGFPSLNSSRLRISCAAKSETTQKVCEIVRTQLALPSETQLTPDSKFSELGADSLDTVEIVMGLEEEFGIAVEEDNAQSIATIQDAAELIDKLVQQKAESA